MSVSVTVDISRKERIMTINREQERAANRNANIGWVAFTLVAAVVVVIGAYTYRNTAAQSDSVSGGTNAIPDRVAPSNTQNQSSPQGPTGPLNTTTNGAPAANPRGETPPGMQSGPGQPNK
jgi:hypothetical protein